nr:MAG TPA: hypothetical protein [Caudoviricetes sp.]
MKESFMGKRNELKLFLSNEELLEKQEQNFWEK